MPKKDPDRMIANLCAELKAIGDPEIAAKEKAYMKSALDFHGVRKPEVDRRGRAFYRGFKDLPVERVISLVQELWQSNYYEEKTLGIVIASRFVRKFTVDHLEEPIGYWIESCEGWDHCDQLSIRVSGPIVRDDPSGVPIVYSWRNSKSLWKRRSSLLSHLPAIRARTVNVEVLLDTCELLLDDDDFFIRKAIGWVLREFTKDYEEEGYEFMVRHRNRASRLTLKEGSRHLTKEQKKKILG